MADEVANPAVLTESASILQQIGASVGETIGNAGAGIRESLVNELANRTIDARKAAVVKVYDLLQSKEQELKKLKPDNVACDGNGKVVSETWSKAAAESRVKLVQEIEKIRNAFDKAFAEKPDWQALMNLAK